MLKTIIDAGIMYMIKKYSLYSLEVMIQWRRKRINKISGSEVDQPDQKSVYINRAEKGKIINVVRKIKTKEEKHIDPNI